MVQKFLRKALNFLTMDVLDTHINLATTLDFMYIIRVVCTRIFFIFDIYRGIKMTERIEKFFKLKDNNTTVKREFFSGITAFITMAYMILVIPNILKFSGMNAQGLIGDSALALNTINDPIVGASFTAICIASGIGCLIMGLYANLPFALAPGMGLVAFFTFSVCLNLGYTWNQALSAVFISGIIFILITLTSIREKIVDSLPQNLKIAISSGIGLFITLIGLKSGGVVVSTPATLVKFGDFRNPGVFLTIIGIMIISILMSKGMKGSILIGIILTTIIGIPMGITNIENISFIKAPPSIQPTLLAFDFKGLIGGENMMQSVFNLIMVVLTFSLVDLFDTIGTLVGTAEKAEMIDENGKVRNMKKALLSDAVGTTIGAALGTPTLATVVESTAGIAEGGRTGLMTTFVGFFFFLSMFFSGVVAIVPAQATAPALIIVGVLMMSTIGKVDFTDLTEGIPAFFTITMMPFSYSIANGVASGVISYVIIKLFTGKRKDIHPIVSILSILFVIRFIVLPD